jgi:preprotein translocase subunit YajC
MPYSVILVAQDAPPADGPAKKQAAPNPFSDATFMFVLMALAVVFFFILPNRQQKKQQEQMLLNIKKGSKVVTVAGIIGTVENLKDNEDEMTIRSGDAKMRVTKSSIARVLGQDDAETAKA